MMVLQAITARFLVFFLSAVLAFGTVLKEKYLFVMFVRHEYQSFRIQFAEELPASNRRLQLPGVLPLNYRTLDPLRPGALITVPIRSLLINGAVISAQSGK